MGSAMFVFVTCVVGAIVLVAVAAILRGWAFSILWGWFVVPIFNLPPIGVAQAIALSMIVGMLTHQYVPSKEKDAWQPFANIFITPLLALGIGWIIKSYI